MTHQQLAQRIAPLYWGALALCGAVVGAASGLVAWHMTGHLTATHKEDGARPQPMH